MENPIKMGWIWGDNPLFSETLISSGHLGPNLSICLFLLGIPFATPEQVQSKSLFRGSDLRVFLVKYIETKNRSDPFDIPPKIGLRIFTPMEPGWHENILIFL